MKRFFILALAIGVVWLAPRLSTPAMDVGKLEPVEAVDIEVMCMVLVVAAEVLAAQVEQPSLVRFLLQVEAADMEGVVVELVALEVVQ